MKKSDYDFGGYVTRNNIKCADGRIIRQNAFVDNDGATVPLVWNHKHDDPFNVIGHAMLENREDGVYGYCKLNSTPTGEHARAMVKNGDITAMSIYANRLKQMGSDVVHGMIREVSLVIAGANEGAYIDTYNFAHSEDSEFEAEMFFDLPANFFELNDIKHSDEDEDENEDLDENDPQEDKEDDTMEIEHADKTVADVFDSMTEEQKQVVYYMLGTVAGDVDDDVEHSDDFDTESEENEEIVEHADDANDSDTFDEATVQDVIDTMSDEQKQVVYYLVGVAAGLGDEESEDDENEDEAAQHSDYEGETFMHTNVFDTEYDESETLSHAELGEIFDDAKRIGSLKESFLQHGITQLEVLYPEAHAVNTTPELITRNMEWVDKVWNGVKKTPFGRIKSTAADLTPDEARAKGYIKGEKKEEEQFELLKRETTPTTVYKKQSMDRDDLIDIRDLDTVSWLRSEMRMMLNEEIARAILVGDGRTALAKDKIKETNIRPIYTDAATYTIRHTITAAEKAEAGYAASIMAAALRARKNYRGSGRPTFFASNDVITELMLATDKIGRRLYNTEAELAAALRVESIVEVPVMEGLTHTEGEATTDLLGIIVNLNDYAVGNDRGGEVTMFDDFDIDYNKEKYLIETRLSGALTKPFSAIVIETEHAAG